MSESRWEVRCVVVKDRPNGLRAWRWSAERRLEKYGGAWKFARDGRAFSLSGALAKATKAGVIAPHMVVRFEFQGVDAVKERPKPAPKPNPLPPELLT